MEKMIQPVRGLQTLMGLFSDSSVWGHMSINHTNVAHSRKPLNQDVSYLRTHLDSSKLWLLRSFEKLDFSEQLQTQDPNLPSERMICVFKACVLEPQLNFFCNKRTEHFMLVCSNFLKDVFENCIVCLSFSLLLWYILAIRIPELGILSVSIEDFI